MTLLQADFSQAFNAAAAARPPADSGWIWGVVIGLAAVLALGAVFAVRQWKRNHFGRMARADEDVFKRMCAANDLTAHQVYLLRRMYHELKLDNPLLLFLSPAEYARHEASLRGKRLALVQALREKVFT